MARGWEAWSRLVDTPVPGDVVRALDDLGVEILRITDDEALGRCPAHLRRTGKIDRHPSWSVNIDSGVHNCFACGFSGPFVVLVQEVLDCDRELAVDWIRERGSIDRAERGLGRGKFIHELAEEEAPNVTEADLALYVEVPQWAAEARDLDPGSCDHYGVLWDPDKDRWIIPIRKPDGTLIGWQEKGEHTRFFRNRPEQVNKATTLFGIQHLTTNTAVLVESPLDVVRLYTAGISGGVSSYGVHVSNAQLDLLVEHGAEYLVSALDNDRDGITANDELRHRVRGRLRLSFFNYGALDVKDPGEMDDAQIWEAYETAYSSILWVRD